MRSLWSQCGVVTTRFKRHDLIKGAGTGREAYKGGRDGLDAPGVRAYPGNLALVLFGLADVLEALRLLGRLGLQKLLEGSIKRIGIKEEFSLVSAELIERFLGERPCRVVESCQRRFRWT